MAGAVRRVSRSARNALFGALLGAFLAGPAWAQISFPPDALPIDPWPGDRIVLGIAGGGCPAPALDPERPPLARQISYTESEDGNPERDSYLHEVSYWMITPPGQVCPLPPPGTTDYLVDLGPLPVGSHQISITRFRDSVVTTPTTIVRRWVKEHVYSPPDISGAWYTPQQSGRGALVLRQNGVTGVWWSTHDSEGQPMWVVLTDPDTYSPPRLEGEAFTTVGPPLSPEPAQLSSERWGNLMFAYRGCGRARLEWQADDPLVGSGGLDLIQLMLPDGVPRCAPETDTGRVQAIWEQ